MFEFLKRKGKEKRKRRVIIESPFRGKNWGKARNIHYAKQCILHSLNLNEAPLASHLLYTQEEILDDNNEENRNLGIEAGHTWIEVADALVVYDDLGISEGMRKGINIAMDKGIKIEYRKIL